MNIAEYEKVKDFTYLQYCDYLQTKYGIGHCDYMTKSWNKNRSVTRTGEGLLAHHKFEDHAIKLAEPAYAKNNPYEWQLAKNIVYCDLLEHLFLHILICKFPAKDKNDGENVGYGGVVNHIAPELNDLYSGWETKEFWRQNCHNLVKNDIKVYFQLLASFIMLYIDDPTFDIRELLKCFNELHQVNQTAELEWTGEKNQELYNKIEILYDTLKDY